MTNTEKAVIIGGCVVAGAAIIAGGIYLGAKYIPYAVEDARHRARQFELDHRAQFAAARKTVDAAKNKVAKAMPHR